MNISVTLESLQLLLHATNCTWNHGIRYDASDRTVDWQVGVGEDLNAGGLRMMASANQSYTVMIESNWTLLADQLVDKLTDISCDSMR